MWIMKYHRCGPCKLIEPVLERCAEQWKDTITIGKFDVACKQSNDVKVELLLKGVMPRSLPSLILLHNNEVVTTWKGVITDNQLNEMLEQHLTLQGLEEDRAVAQKKIPKVVGMPAKEPPRQRKAGFVSFAMNAGGDDYMLKHA
jgi:thioredoxin 1